MEVESIAETAKPKFLRFAPGEVIKTLLTNLSEYRVGDECSYNLLINTNENDFCIIGSGGYGECLTTRFSDFRINKNILAIRCLSIPGVYVFERSSEADVWMGNRVLIDEVSHFIFNNALILNREVDKLDRERDKVTITTLNEDLGIETVLKFKSIITI